MSQRTDPTELIALYGFLAVVLISVRAGRRHPANQGLAKGERARPILVTWLDPVVVLVFVGPLLVHEMGLSPSHVATALLGAAIGIPIGIVRSRIMFVRAIAASRSVVFVRSPAEYALLSVLVVIRVSENSIRTITSGPLTMVLTALLALGVAESVTRSIGITLRYRRDLRTNGPEAPGLI